MKTRQSFGLTLAMTAVLATAAFAQGMFAQRPRDPGEQVGRFLGRNAAFSATAHTTIQTAGGKEMPGMEFSYAILDGKVRTEMDLMKMHGADMSPEGMAQMKQMGMDRTVHIFLPDQSTSYMIYPSMKAYCEISATQTTGQKEAKEPKIEKTDLGKDTIDGHPCVKSKVVVTDPDGRKHESLVWQATDLKDFPIQIQTTTEDGSVMTTTFKNINQTKPAASLFEPPADYKRFASMQQLMMGGMHHMMPPGMPPHGAMPPHGTAPPHGGMPPPSGDE
jgi:hypothetical protein